MYVFFYCTQQAIAANSFFEGVQRLQCGDVDQALTAPGLHVLEGEVRIGGQEHFYLETQATLVVPRGEDEEIEIYCSTQAPAHAQVRGILHFVHR